MKVLVINCGSSSLKFQLIDSETEQVLAKGLCERIGIDGRLTYSPAGGGKLPSGIKDLPLVRVRGVFDAHVSLGNDTDRMFSFEGYRLYTRRADDITLLPDWQWGVRRALGFAWIAFLSVLVAFCAFVAVVAFRRHHARVGAEAIAADRRRIAAELHDTISQHISGAKLWVYSAKMAAGDTLAPGAADALVMAENVLEATRREIRDAIMDLQSDEFVSQSTESLLRSMGMAAISSQASNSSGYI